MHINSPRSNCRPTEIVLVWSISQPQFNFIIYSSSHLQKRHIQWWWHDVLGMFNIVYYNYCDTVCMMWMMMTALGWWLKYTIKTEIDVLWWRDDCFLEVSWQSKFEVLTWCTSGWQSMKFVQVSWDQVILSPNLQQSKFEGGNSYCLGLTMKLKA